MGLQFGMPRVKGLSQYINELFTPAGNIALWMVMPKFITGTSVPWLLIYWRQENLFGILGPFSTIEGAILAALRVDEPYVLILYCDTSHNEICGLIKESWDRKSKCAVFALSPTDTKEVSHHLYDLPLNTSRKLATVGRTLIDITWS